MAVSHSVLVILYHVLRDPKSYTYVGVDYFDRLDIQRLQRLQRHHVRRLEQLGSTVTLTPAPAA